MKTFVLSSLRLLACLATVLFSAIPGRCAGFPVGQLLVANSFTVYLVDPASGSSNILVTGLTGLKDVVFNPVSSSAFAAVGSNIVQITASGTSYAMTPFVTGVADLQCLAVDAFGRVHFNQRDFVQHRLWRAALDGTITSLTPASFFVPRHMVFSRDFSRLYVFETPANDIKVVNLPSGAISTLVSDLDFPPGGDSDADGNVYVLEDFSTAQISKVTPAGIKTVLASQPWMNFVSSDDLEFEDLTGTIYATSTSGLYALLPDLTNRRLLPGSGFFTGLSLVRPGLPLIISQPTNVITSSGNTVTFSITASGAASYQWRLNGTNIPGANGASLTIPNVGENDAGSYSVFVVSTGGAAVSSSASLSLFSLAINPVLSLTGPIGANYRIDYRVGLQSANAWQVLTNVTATSNPFLVVDQTGIQPALRFYRAVSIP